MPHSLTFFKSHIIFSTKYRVSSITADTAPGVSPGPGRGEFPEPGGRLIIAQGVSPGTGRGPGSGAQRAALPSVHKEVHVCEQIGAFLLLSLLKMGAALLEQ